MATKGRHLLWQIRQLTLDKQDNRCSDCSPQVVLLPFDCDDHFVQMPLIRNVWTFTTQLIGVLLPEPLTPFSNRFVPYLDAAVQHHILAVPIAQGKEVVEPDTVTNDFARKAITEIHGQADASIVEAERLFYIPVNLTMPLSLLLGASSALHSIPADSGNLAFLISN
jgi:hypothetical protein